MKLHRTGSAIGTETEIGKSAALRAAPRSVAYSEAVKPRRRFLRLIFSRMSLASSQRGVCLVSAVKCAPVALRRRADSSSQTHAAFSHATTRIQSLQV